ncbi:hypothetical protein [Butyrivibrio sp. JL13D10]|uniref:hypothetical protein n=1 Tax=Butyrivibrio sp. JL13D10 TaxID=3236815 RepID=UPI0038B562F5
MNINEEKRNQWQALKGMGFKAHWDYFWDYYKIHVIVGIIVIVAAVSMIKDIVSQKPFALSCTFINTASMNEADSLTNEFAQYEGIDTSKYVVSIDASSTINMENPDQFTVANSERIYAMIAARDLDIIMADEAIFKNYVGNEMYQDLSGYFTADELAAFGDKVVYVDPESLVRDDDMASLDAEAAAVPRTADIIENPSESEKAKLMPIGIKLENNSHLTALEYYPGEPAYIGIVTATERADTAADFIRYLAN